MANPIQKNDLISDEALRALEEISRLLREDKESMEALMGTCKQYAGIIQSVTATNNGSNDALTIALQRISELEKAYSDLQKAMKENAATQKAINAEKRMYSKLTQEEATEVKNLRTELKWLNDEDKNVVEYVKKKIAAINTEKMSYNQLQQTYNALMDSIKRMATEEVRNSEAGKLMVNTAKQIRETMNETQKSVGNFTLQVGKYRAAFDGLGYSFQQILREIPSALNPQQFFLAISNNIPLFMDQVKAFKAEQEQIKIRMKELEVAGQTATEEYQNLGNKVESFGSKMRKSIFSWQTAILAIVMALRSYGQDIINWIGTLFNGAETMAQRLKNLATEIHGEAAKNYQETVTELQLLLEKMDEVNYAGNEYKDIVARINEITGSTFDITKNMPDEIRKATEEYIRMQKVIAVNAAIIGKMTPSLLIRNAMTGAKGTLKADDVKAYLKPFVTDDDDLSMIASMIASKNTVEAALREGRMPNFGMYEFRFGNILRNAASGVSKAASGDYNWAMVDPTVYGYEGLSNISLSDERRKYLEEYLRLIKKEIDKELSEYGYLSDAEMAKLESMYDAEEVNLNRRNKGRKERKPAEQEMNNQYWEAAEARRNIMLVGYQKELADEKAAHLKQMQEQARANEEMQKAVEENVKNGYLSRAEGDRKIQELQKQNDDIMEGLILEHNKRVNVINTKYAEMDRKVIVEEELGWIEELDAAYKVDENNRRRRIKTIKDEELSNQRITESILKMREEIEKLQEKNLTQPEAIEQRTKRIQELEKAIAKLQTQIDHTKQLSNYSSIGDIFRRNVSVGAGTQQSLMERILGKDAYSAFAPGSKELQDAIEKDFDTWMKSAEQTLTTWYSTTMGYINDLISAYVELANAKAEAAKEATDAAQEEYEKEKALLEAGYASRVEATWAEYQEKKAAQEKAEADAKAAAQAQKQLNEVETAGSMIVAAANIWKTFSGMGPVGIALAAVATAGMFAAFIASKAKAAEVSKYGEGDVQLVGGGSHASGHDTLLGYSLQGKEMRVENGEVVGIVPRRSVRRIGEQNVLNTMRALRDGTFEANTIKRIGIERNVGMSVLSAPRTDLHRVESDLHKLVSYGSRSRTVNADGSVTEIRKNAKIVYKNG